MAQPEQIIIFDMAWDAVLKLRLVQAAFTRDMLPERNAWIVKMRDRGETLEDIGRALGISRERVRQLEKQERRSVSSLGGVC